MPSISDISSSMRSRLRIVEPDLDTSVGTPIRKILDVVAESVAEASVDGYLLDYQYDIESRVGADLDAFVKLFGFSRLPARRATGQITFSRTEAAIDNIIIPINTRLATANSPQIVFSTITPAILGVGSTSISAPAQAVEAGTSGNVSASTISLPISSVSGISSSNNTLSFTGGVDAESDAALRDRYRKTIFRSLAGTEAMFAGTALEDGSVTQVNVLGSSKSYREQIELVGGTATSTILGATHIFEGSSYFGEDLDGGAITNEGVHYVFDHTSNPPTVTSLSAAIVPDGVYELEYKYSPDASRNDPDNNITNRVDLWIKGERATPASESLIFSTDRVFQSGSAVSDWYTGEYQRPDETAPTAGNFFIPYGFVPLVNPSTSGSVIIDGLTYVENTDFWMIHRTGADGFSPQSYAGIEFLATANGLVQVQPPDDQSFTSDYVFNSVPSDVQSAIQRWRLVTVDVQAHQAEPLYLDCFFAVILLPGFDEGSVQADMFSALTDFIDRVGFNSVVQASDLLAVGHSVVGVDAIRFLTSTDDGTQYAIQRVNVNGGILETYQTGGRAIDVRTDDDSIPVLRDVTLTIKAANSFGTV